MPEEAWEERGIPWASHQAQGVGGEAGSVVEGEAGSEEEEEGEGGEEA